MLLSTTDNRSAAFVDNDLIIGTADDVRRCLQAKTASPSVNSLEALRQAQQKVDVSLPISALSFTDDRRAAISFIESLAPQNRSAFAANGPAIETALKRLPFAVSVSIVKGQTLDWTSRSSFGLAGSLVVQLMPEESK